MSNSYIPDRERPKWWVPMKKLLCRASEDNSIESLAESLGMSFQGIYLWLERGRIPQDRVTDIITVADGRVTVEELLPYVLKSSTRR